METQTEWYEKYKSYEKKILALTEEINDLKEKEKKLKKMIALKQFSLNSDIKSNKGGLKVQEK